MDDLCDLQPANHKTNKELREECLPNRVTLHDGLVPVHKRGGLLFVVYQVKLKIMSLHVAAEKLT